MDPKPRNLGRAYLVEKLRERGLSRRQAVRILNEIFLEMSEALARGEDVEFPFGYLTRVDRRVFMNCELQWPRTVQHEFDEPGSELFYGRDPEPERGRGRARKTGK